MVEAAFQNSYRVTENQHTFILQSFAGLCFLVNTAGSIAVVYTVIDTTNIINVSHAQPHTVYNVSMSSSVEITQHIGFQWSKPTNCCSVSLSSQKLVYVVDHSDGKKNNHKS